MNIDHAQQANNTLSENSSAIAQQGNAAVNRMVETMSKISTRSEKIADITGIIEGIAFQTNILAMNAAVPWKRRGPARKDAASQWSHPRCAISLSVRRARRRRSRN